MSKTYQALVKAERLRAAQDPAALERRVARTAEEGETLRAELRVCQEQLAALIARVDALATSGPATIDDLGRQIARLADVQRGVGPTVETIHRTLDELRRRGDELQRTQQTERQTLTANLGSLSDAMARALKSVGEQQREQQRLLEELDAVRAEQQDGGRQGERLTALSESIAEVEAIRRADVERLQAEVQSLRQGLDRAPAAPPESTAVPVAIPSEQMAALRAELDALRQQLSATDQDQRQLQQRWEEQLKEQHQGLSSLSAQAIQVAQESVEDAQAARQSLVERLAAIEEMQTRSDRSLHDLLGRLDSLLTGQTHSAGEIDALRVQVAALSEVQSRQQQQIAASAQRAQAGAKEAARRAAAIDEAHSAGVARLQQQVAKLQTDEGSLRDALGAVQSSLAEQVVAGLDTLRTQIAAHHNDLADATSHAQSAADEAARRIAANEEEQSSTLAGLRQQLDALQADSSSWRGISATLQSAVVRQEQSAAEIDVLRRQIARMGEAQQRQQQLFEDLLLAPASSDDRSAAPDSGEAADLRRQIVALQVDRLKLDGFLEARFETLCDILDAEMEAKLDEIRAGVGLPIESARFSRKRLSEALARWSSRIAALRKKEP